MVLYQNNITFAKKLKLYRK